MDLAVIFHDITPIPQDDGPQPVCAINYPSRFVEAMGYLRAVLKVDEHTQRTLDLTTTCLRLNPANYTTWHFRREILATLSEADNSRPALSTSKKNYYDPDRVNEDLAMTESLVVGNNPKNYQIWHHRRSLLEFLIESRGEVGLKWAREELEYTACVFDADSKNYHAWSHRQWIVQTIDHEDIWESELDYTDTLITEDIRNNSAWNHRWFTSHRAKKNPPLSLKIATSELNFAVDVAKLDPFNESPWRYLVGLLLEQYRKFAKDTDDNSKIRIQQLLETYLGKVVEIEDDLKESSKVERGSCTNLVSAMIDVLELQHQKDSLGKAAKLAHDLGMTHDVIRKKYWYMREKELKEKGQRCD